MKVAGILRQLRLRRIRIIPQGNDLRVKGPRGSLSEELKTALRSCKAELLSTLKQGVPPYWEKDGDGPSEKTIPFSPAQQRFWVLEHLRVDANGFHQAVHFQINGLLCVSQLERAFHNLIQENPLLEAGFSADSDRPRFTLVERAPTPLRIIDLDRSAGKNKKKLRAAKRRFQEQSFDLHRGPLWRAALIRFGPRDHHLLFCCHRLVMDGSSKELLIRLLAAFYEEPALRPATPKLEAFFNMADKGKRDRLLFKQDLNFWKYQLTDVEEVLELPQDVPRPRLQRFAVALHSLCLPESLLGQLKSLFSYNYSIEQVLWATYILWLARTSGRKKFLVARLKDLRIRHSGEEGIGNFELWLPLKIHWAGRPSFRKLLDLLSESATLSLSHDRVSFEAIVEELNPKRDSCRQSLCQIGFLRRADRQSLPTLGAATLRDHHPCWNTAEFDFALVIEPSGKNLAFQYNPRLFYHSTIRRMAAHFRTLLESIGLNPERNVDRLALLTHRERTDQLTRWNNTQHVYGQDLCIHQLFFEQVKRTPQAVALAFAGSLITYEELERRAHHLAHCLEHLGAGPNRLVGIYMERSLEIVIALFAILKTGAGYMPLDPEFPKNRLAYILEDAKPSCLLTQPRLRAALPVTDTPIFCWQPSWLENLEEPYRHPFTAVDSSHLAYVIYTSAGSGTPRGVMNSHRAICNRLLWLKQAHHPIEADRILQKMSFSYDISVWETFLTLASGACVVVAEAGGNRNSAYLAKMIAERGITIVHFVPFMLQAFLEYGPAAERSALRKVFCSGGTLPLSLTDLFRSRYPNANLSYLFGPLEAAVDVTFWACNSRLRGFSAPIGTPIANIRTYVLDPYLEPLPIGVVGELCISGTGLARGYLKSPALTAAKFVPDPFGRAPSNRLYKTGDLVRYRADGNLEIWGHVDRQVRIRGIHVKLDEVKTVLSEHPEVREAYILAREQSADVPELVGYFTPFQEATPEIEELYHYLRRHLPAYMIPAQLIPLDAFPLNLKGKIDADALPLTTASVSDPPVKEWISGEVERVLTSIWQEVLRIKDVRVGDNLFDIGGNSLMLMGIFNRLPEVLRRHLNLVDVFRHPTIRGLALYLEKAETRERGTPERSEPWPRDATPTVRSPQPAPIHEQEPEFHGREIAVIGMAGRFPGADGIETFWENLCNGVESIAFYSDRELREEGIDSELLENPLYIKAKGELADVQHFDASFFGFTPREAQITDPQHRLFLECAWEAMETAGYDVKKTPRTVGVYGGSGMSYYLTHHLSPNPYIWERVGAFSIMIAGCAPVNCIEPTSPNPPCLCRNTLWPDCSCIGAFNPVP